MSFADVQRLVDLLRDGLDLRAELRLNFVQIRSVVDGDQIDRNSEMSETARATDSVQVRLGHLREVEVYDDIDGLNVDAASEQVRAHEIAAQAISELVEHTIAVRLRHLRVNIVAVVAKFGDLFREKFDALSRVAKDDRLIYLQFAEERVQAVHLLLLLNEGVVLRHTF